MNTRTVILITLLAFGAGGLCGYIFRARSADSSLVLSAKGALIDEYVTPPDTFSRIKNTRNALDSLSTRVALEISETLVVYDGLPRTSESERRKSEEILARAIHASEGAMQEFEGTPQQLVIVPAFLRALRMSGQFNRWIEVYVQTLYAHPTHAVVCNLANDATKISKVSGQQQQVLEALRYLIACPAQFEGRAEVQAAFTSAFASTTAEVSVQPSQTDHPFKCLQL